MTKPAAIVLACVAPVANAQLHLIEPVPGYDRVIVTAVSTDGSTLAVNMSNADGGGVDAFTRSGGVWHALARYGSQNRVISLSDDGRATLTVSHNAYSGLNQLVYERDGVRTLTCPPTPMSSPPGAPFPGTGSRRLSPSRRAWPTPSTCSSGGPTAASRRSP
jgi:hypothetical protein